MQLHQLGPYRIQKRLGQGGMGAVYEGVDTATGETVAIKVLAPQLATDEGFRVRFQAEIESLKKLRHPNIVRLFGYGEEQSSLFYSMELVRGSSLEDELRAGRRFDWREVTDLAICLCRALKHAHDAGVIHRDIKPA
ncbi:MAG TPA: serine/threonine-protein kinase, partial [Pirellulales bacterium]|nr:serine/threonine-protein kinase [Pirellulales bacterium]